MMLSEAIKTSAIEGEFPNRKDVLSSIRKNLGLHTDPGFVQDKSAAGLAELMIDVRKTFVEPMTTEKLFAWHRMLMGQHKRIKAGKWRTHKDPMQVVSGVIGKEKVHFEAPPSKRVPQEMHAFIQWFNDTAPGGIHEMKKAPVRSALAHLYFESIHPFEDGNGRIGRAIAEKALSQTIGRPVLLSLSRTIEANKAAYYQSLEQAQRSNEVSAWVAYFVGTVLDAQIEAETQVDFTLRKTRFLDRYKPLLNDRQEKVLTRMLAEGPTGFEGGMQARKYIAITGASKATATRDLKHLLDIGAFTLVDSAGGRSTRYALNF
jgi:Fic family protein